MAGREVIVEADAKINAFLRVVGRRTDGYHDIESLILPVSLADVLTFRDRDQGVSLSVTGWPPDLPGDEGNLVLAATKALADRTGEDRGLAIELVKRIPVAAGLGGGSADAAATFRALNDLWGCGLSPEELMALGAAIGSDVPALVHGRPVMVRGRGEVIEPVRLARTWWVLRPLDFPVSASDAYGWWDRAGSTGPEPASLLDAALNGRMEALAGHLFNDLEPVVVERHPQVLQAREALLDAGALGAVMSGSGPTVAALVRDEGHAREVAAAVHGAIPVSAPP